MTPAPVARIALARIYANPDLSPKQWDPAALAAAAREPVRPVTVVHRPRAAGDYCLVLGERTWRAAQLAGWPELPAIIRQAPPASFPAVSRASLPGAAAPALFTRAGAQRLPLARIRPNPAQPRKHFEAGALAELARSIRSLGLLQPITVAPREGGFIIVAGERRWRAAALAGHTEIEALVREDLSERDLAELALVENLVRADLGIVEEARAYGQFLERGYTPETIAETLGYRNTTRVRMRLAILRLAPELLEGVERGAVSPAQAQEMSRLSIEGQFALWRAIGEGRCDSQAALKRTASAIYDRENQVALFKSAALGANEKAALARVDVFLAAAGRLLSVLSDEDLSLLEEIPKSNARASADQLALIEKLCRDLRSLLLANAAKQELLEDRPPAVF